VRENISPSIFNFRTLGAGDAIAGFAPGSAKLAGRAAKG
jgi:hypothetical protein